MSDHSEPFKMIEIDNEGQTFGLDQMEALYRVEVRHDLRQDRRIHWPKLVRAQYIDATIAHLPSQKESLERAKDLTIEEINRCDERVNGLRCVVDDEMPEDEIVVVVATGQTVALMRNIGADDGKCDAR